MGKPLYGYVAEGYWQDIGTLDQYRRANFDALDGRVKLNIQGVRLRGNIWVGEGVELADLEAIEGPAYLGNYSRIGSRASIGPYSVLSTSVTLRDHARTTRSVIDASTYIGRSAVLEGAIVGKSCDVRPHARLHEGVAVGDSCTIGEQSVVMPGVSIYPFKEVEAGAVVDRHLIWESRTPSRLFGRDAVSGLINVDLTPEIALRIGIALGTALKRGERVVMSRAAPPACRLLKRAVLSGVISTGVHVADLHVMPPAVTRHFLKNQGMGAGIHVRPSAQDPEVMEIQLFEASGAQAAPQFIKEIEKHYLRQEFRRAAHAEVGKISSPARAAEAYVEDLLRRLDVESIRARSFRMVVEYSHSAASLVLPLVLGPLGVEAIGSHPYAGEHAGAPSLAESLGQAKRLVTAAGADLGVVLDESGERIYLVDEQAHEVPVEQELLLFLSLLASDGKKGTLALPTTVTSLAEPLVENSELSVRRTPASLADLTRTGATDNVVFAGSVGGGFVFPDFLPAYDGVTSLCKLLELLAPVERPLSELVAALPESTVVHREVRCPWARKGAVMRVVTERVKGKRVETLDGIKVFEKRGWVQVLPDPDEPLVHVYAEGTTAEDAASLEEEFLSLVEEVVSADGDTPGA
jgi:mannose-1-phosphate guanylyltransferase / phosphomannomutase